MLKVFVLLLFMLNLSNSYRYFIILRHGESVWNKNELYTGWANAQLTSLGIKEAKIAGRLINEYGIIPTLSYSSKLQRAIDTSNIILNELKEINGKDDIVHFQDWRLNERHYGKLTGYNRENIQWTGEYFDIPPININKLDNYTLLEESTYKPEFGESHYMTNLRVKPVLNNFMYMVKNSQIPMVCTHKNTARALMKNIEHFSENEINNIVVPNATPIIYKFDEQMKLIDKIILSHEDFPHFTFD